MKHKIVLFTDYICPFCWIGKGLMDTLKKEYDIEEITHYVEIHPDTPNDGYDLQQRFPHVSIPNLYGRLRKRGLEEFDNIDYGTPKILSNSHKASLIAIYAEEKGKIDEYSNLVFEAYFKTCEDIGKNSVLQKIVEKVGFDWKEEIEENVLKGEKYDKILNEKHVKMKEAKVSGVPHFIIDGTAVSGAQDINYFRRIFRSKEMSKK